MIPLSSRAQAISPSLTFAIASRAKKMTAQGLDVCNFGVGEPDFATPRYIREAAKAALDQGMTKYTPPPGLPRLRALIAQKLRDENGLSCTTAQVMVTVGGKQALFNALMTLVSPGDEVLIPMPYWVTYPEIVKMAHGQPVYIPTTETSRFKITPEQLDTLITPQTRVLILNSPANPTGAVYTREELRALADVIVAHNIAVVSDEIYEKLTYNHIQHVSLASLGEDIAALTVTCNGFSKAYAATGWRLGYAAGPTHIIKAATNIQAHVTSCANTFAQYGAIAALEGAPDTIEAMRQVFEQRRDRLFTLLNDIADIQVAQPQGAFYIFPNISAFGLGSLAFCQQLLEQEYVALVPGIGFGADANVRISYATDMGTIEKGVAGLRRYVERLS